MAVEFHIAEEQLTRLVAGMFQDSQRQTCMAPVGEVYVQWANPVPAESDWTFDGSAAELRLAVDVGVSTRDEVLAAVDQPAGAQVTPLRLTIVLRVALVDRALTFTVTDVEFGITGQLAAIRDAVRRAMSVAAGAMPSIELGELMSALGAAQPGSSAALLMANRRLIARFGDFSVPPAPVDHQFEWALFVDGGTIERFVHNRIPTSFPRLGILDTQTSWTPFGEVPFLRASINSITGVAGIGFDVLVNFGFTPSMASPMLNPVLRFDVDYSISVSPPLPEPALSATAAVVEDELERELIDPARFGGFRTGPSSFAMSVPLPQFRVAGRMWHYEGLVSGLAGMVLGGAVFVPSDLSGSTLRITSLRRFSGATHADLWCHLNQLPTVVPHASLFKTVAYVEYERGGSLCDVEVIPAGMGLEEHLTLPKAIPLTGGRRPGDGKIFIAFGLAKANSINEEIKLVIRTTRGVRCVNLGMPEHVTIKEDGTIDGSVMYWDDCNMLPPSFLDGSMTPEEYDRWTGVIWYTYWGLKPGEYDPDNPPIIPDTLDQIPPHWDESLVVPRVRFQGSLVTPKITVVVPDTFKVLDIETLASPEG